MSGQGKGAGDGNGRGQALVSGGISACAVCFVFIAGGARRLRGAKRRADERSEKVRRLCAGSACKSKLLCSDRVRGVSLGFAGAVRATCGIGQLFEVSWGGSEEERGAGDFSRAQG